MQAAAVAELIMLLNTVLPVVSVEVEKAEMAPTQMAETRPERMA
jgi:hypothetical protein